MKPYVAGADLVPALGRPVGPPTGTVFVNTHLYMQKVWAAWRMYSIQEGTRLFGVTLPLISMVFLNTTMTLEG